MERELLLLGLLRRGEMHGYQLNEYISGILANCIDLKKPTAYFLLDKLAARGWVSVSEDRAGNRPPRKVYRITAAGEQAFQDLLRQNLSAYQTVSFANDIGLAFMDALDPGEARTHLLQRRIQLAAELDQARRIPLHGGSLQLMIEHRAVHLAAELDWLDRVLARLHDTPPVPVSDQRTP